MNDKLRKNVFLICDLQFGSTGKGLIAGHLAKNRIKPDTVITAWAPNAGHTFIDSDGRKFVHRMLANGIVSPNLRRVLLGPGSMIDVEVLRQEINNCLDLLKDTQVFVHEHAAIVGANHREIEDQTMTSIGSTKKGTGAALMQKIRRDPYNMNIAHPRSGNSWFKDFSIDIQVVSAQEYAVLVDESETILIEGAQGYSLGINSGFYPYTTSRECTPGQIMVDCAIPHDRLFKVIGTARTYPIRVANRYDDQGNQIGWSGPCYADQREMKWEELGVEPELTTVTKLPRRVFSFSEQQIKDAIRACRPDVVFLNFANYAKDPGLLDHIIGVVNNCSGKKVVKWLGYGPTVDDIRPQAIDQINLYKDPTQGGIPFGEKEVLW